MKSLTRTTIAALGLFCCSTTMASDEAPNSKVQVGSINDTYTISVAESNEIFINIDNRHDDSRSKLQVTADTNGLIFLLVNGKKVPMYDPNKDICKQEAWYGDGICDEDCPLPDPDCSTDNEEANPTPSYGDICEQEGWYNDGICDVGCGRPDPDCE